MDLDWEQTFVSQAVDMLIGQRAQVLIGNGVRLAFFASERWLLISDFTSSYDITVLQHDVQHRHPPYGQWLPSRKHSFLVEVSELTSRYISPQTWRTRDDVGSLNYRFR